MKSHYFILVILVNMLFMGHLCGQTTQRLYQGPQYQSALEIDQDSPTQLSVSLQTPDVMLERKQTEQGVFFELKLAAYGKSHAVGDPQLPVYRRLIEIPQGAEPRIEILDYDTEIVSLYAFGIQGEILPRQASQPKCGDVYGFQYNSQTYQTNAFYQNELVSIEVLGTMRSQRLARLNMAPVQYNPQSGEIRIVKNIRFRVIMDNADLLQTQLLKNKTRSFYYSNLYGQRLNSQYDQSSRENLTQYPITYVIISHRMFETQLQDFIAWKKRKGFTVVEAYTDVIGTHRDDIKAYIQGLYDAGTPENPSPSFVLFVGDLSQMPTYDNGDGVTDRNYVEYTGDLFPEIFYGRFSAETTDHLQAYIDKTLMYEEYTMPMTSYLDTVVLVSGVDGSYAQDWGNGQINYGTINYFNDAHDIYSHTYLYPASGSASAQIQQNVSDGVTFGNYTAHCSPNGWADPSFTMNDVANLQNQDKYGLLIGNCCSSSEYQTTCFGEVITRTADKGCVGYIGGSNSTYWDEDYYFGVGVGTISENPPPYEETTLGNYDRSFHDHGEAFGEWYTTMDQIIFAGNLAVSESGSSLEQYYWDIYNLLGDPALMIYYSVPEEMTVSHETFILVGATSFEVNSHPYAYVVLNRDGENLGTALADENGVAVVEFEMITVPGEVELVITAQNFQPYISTIEVFSPDGPYCIYEAHSLNDTILGNGNGQAEFDEEVHLTVAVANYGNEDAHEVDVVLSTDDTYLNLVDQDEFYGSILADETKSVADAFVVHLADNVPDQHIINLDVIATDNQDSSWSSQFSLTAMAPNLAAVRLVVDDEANGNDNGRLDPGETATIKIETVNNGHCLAYQVHTSLIAYNAYVNVLSEDTTLPVVSTMGACFPEFEVEVDADAPEGIIAEMRFQMLCGGYDVVQTFFPKIGQILEDWESGGFSSFNWQEDGDLPWVINSQYPFEGVYDAASGDIDDNSTSELYISYYVMGNDSISFHRKVSSEPDYDFLTFYIDNVAVQAWSGINESWQRQAYAVEEGMHTFKWVYSKDFNTTGGADKAWLDNISLPSMMMTTVFAGPDAEDCALEPFPCDGTATNYDSIYWHSSGSGVFDNMNLLNPLYTASQTDLDNRSVQLVLNIVDVDGLLASDTMQLEFIHLDAPEMPDGPTTVDLELITNSDYSIPELDLAENYQWSVYPPEAGLISGNGLVGTVTWTSTFEGFAWIKAAGVNACGIGIYSDSLEVEIINPLTSIAPHEKGMFSIQPNPTHDFALIKFSQDIQGTASIKIVDIKGEVLESHHISELSASVFTIDMSHRSAGLYHIILETQEGTSYKKLILLP